MLRPAQDPEGRQKPEWLTKGNSEAFQLNRWLPNLRTFIGGRLFARFDGVRALSQYLSTFFASFILALVASHPLTNETQSENYLVEALAA